MAITRPKRLTTVATEPVLLPLKVNPEEDGSREALSVPPEPEAAEEISAEDQPTVTPRRVATLR